MYCVWYIDSLGNKTEDLVTNDLSAAWDNFIYLCENMPGYTVHLTRRIS
jgi:hypothetical protein